MIDKLIVYQENTKYIDIPTAEQLVHLTNRYNGCFLYTTPGTGINPCRWFVGLVPMVTHTGLEIVTPDNRIQTTPLGGIDRITSNAQISSECPLWLGYVGWDMKNRLEEPGLYQDSKDPDFEYARLSVYRYVLEIEINQPKAILYTLNLKSIDTETFPVPDFNLNPTFTGFRVTQFSTNKEKERFISDVERIKEYIRSGDIYQANLTREIAARFDGSAERLTLHLLNSNNIEFGGYLKFNNKHLISTSPERFFKVEGTTITTSPIKGTAPRGKINAEDTQIAQKLLNDTKNRRELAMIVDLLRNDISRICHPGSVTVDEFPKLITLSNVFHLVADISGQLITKSFEKIIRALFPGGSISGCPKIRACQIIDELEIKPRGPYTGTMGYIRKNMDMDFNILIRTVLLNGNSLRFNVGGGITLLSDPEEEFAETCHKAGNILKALQNKE